MEFKLSTPIQLLKNTLTLENQPKITSKSGHSRIIKDGPFIRQLADVGKYRQSMNGPQSNATQKHAPQEEDVSEWHLTVIFIHWPHFNKIYGKNFHI